MKNLIEPLKTGLALIVIIGLLKVTGLMTDISFITQTVAIKAGVLNASPSERKVDPNFDYTFSVKDLKGNKISFDKYKGKVVFLNLWATWCGPCKAEMPGIHNLYMKMKGEPVEFVMLSIDKDQALPKVESYIKKNSYTFPVFMPSGYLAEQLQVPSIPTTFVISKDGKVVMKEVGTRNYDTRKMLEFLKKQAAL
jgi:thiol-disulfide isomerase/thioredoxin